MSLASARASFRSADLPAPGSPTTSKAPLRRSRAASSSARTRSCSPSRPYSMNPAKQPAEPDSRAQRPMPAPRLADYPVILPARTRHPRRHAQQHSSETATEGRPPMSSQLRASPVPDPRRWWALGLLSVAQFLVILDTSIIGVALPAIKDALGFSTEGLQWVFNAYVIAFGGLLLVGGRLADLLRPRRLFAAASPRLPAPPS